MFDEAREHQAYLQVHSRVRQHPRDDGFVYTRRGKTADPQHLSPFHSVNGRSRDATASDEASVGDTDAHLPVPPGAIAQLSHELGTPLISIKESARLLRMEAMGPLTAEQQEAVKTIESTSAQLLRLVRNMLDLSKSQLGHLELFRQPLDLDTLIQVAWERLTTLLGRRTVSVKAQSLPPVFADRDRLLQIFTNLLDNAVKFTADDGRIAVRAAVRGSFAEVAVMDNGAGIPAERLASLFEPFQQAHPCAAKTGTGLGLAICKELVELHGGTIKVSSIVGQGTTVTFSVPLFTPQGAVETFMHEIRQEGAPSDLTVTVCLVRLAGLAGKRSTHPAAQERAEGVMRGHLRASDRLCWFDPETVLIVSATDLRGAQQIITRLCAAQPELTQAAGGGPLALLYGLACSGPPDDRTAEALLQEARANLEKMAAAG